VFATGGPGIVHFDGTSWRQMAGDTATQTIGGSGAADVFALGTQGRLLHYNGLGWSPIRFSSNVNLESVWAAPSVGFVVGSTSGGGSTNAVARIDHPVACGARELSCTDGWDNDCDGLTDACDPDCAGTTYVEQCANGIDDDCDGLTDCADPDCAGVPYCQRGGSCLPIVPITCGSSVAGTNVGGPNKHTSYACGGRDENGPEAFYDFTPAHDGTVTATLSGFGADLDLIALGAATTGACDAEGSCVTATSTPNATQAVSFSVSAGHRYFLVVDTADPTGSSFTLELACP
jgi:hypothetical protein